MLFDVSAKREIATRTCPSPSAARARACQVRKDNAPANLACIRRIALTQIKQETTKKLGIQGKRRRAGWDTDYLQTVLGAHIPSGSVGALV